MKIKKQVNKTEKKLKKFEKYAKKMNATGYKFIIKDDDKLYLENFKKHESLLLPENLQTERMKSFLINVQNGTTKEYIKKLAEELESEEK